MRSSSVFRIAVGWLVRDVHCAPQKAASVCLYNDAGAVIHWHLLDTETNQTYPETKSYPLWQVRCLEPGTLDGLRSGATLVPVVQAVWGETYTAPPFVHDALNASQLTYRCTGETWKLSCQPGASPITPGDVAKDMAEFLDGFVDGLGEELGVKNCANDFDSLYKDVMSMVKDMQKGIDNKIEKGIMDAFIIIGDILKIIKDCGEAVAKFIAKIKNLAEALSGNPVAIIKTIVKEGMHIYNDRKDLTSDCKAIVADWNAGDFHGSGRALGDIVGDLISGLGSIPMNETEIIV